MYSIVSNKKTNYRGTKPYRSHRTATNSPSVTELVASLPTFDKISIAGRIKFQCRFFACKYISTQHAQLIVHQTLTHGLIECEKCSVAYFSKTEKDNCLAKHESQEIAESTRTELANTVDHDLQNVIDGILAAEEENLVTLTPTQPPPHSPQLTSIPSTSQSSGNFINQQTESPTIKLQHSLKRFKCQHAECGRLFTNEWALKSHFCAMNNYIIPSIPRLDSLPKINKETVKSKKAKSDESIDVCSTASSSDGETDDVKKDETWIPRSNKRFCSLRKLPKKNRIE